MKALIISLSLLAVFASAMFGAPLMFYKITKAEADSIGVFKTPEGEFDPYICEQVDGTFPVTNKQYDSYKDTPQFQKVNWVGKQLYPMSDLNPKIED